MNILARLNIMAVMRITVWLALLSLGLVAQLNADSPGDGNTLLNAGKFAEAEAAFERTLESTPQNHQAFFGRGRARLNLKKYEPAIADFTEALRLKPDLWAAAYNRGLARKAQGQHEAALPDWSAYIKGQPDDVDGWFERGYAFIQLKRYAEAVADYTEALRLKPNYLDAVWNRATAHRLREAYAAARDDYSAYLERKQDNHWAYYWRGQCQVKLKQYAACAADYSEALRVKPDFTGCYYDRAVVRGQLKQWAEAEMDLDEFIRRDPKDADGPAQRGYVRFNRGNLAGALVDCDAALRLNPEHANAKTNRELILKEQAAATPATPTNTTRTITFADTLPGQPLTPPVLTTNDFATIFAKWDEDFALAGNEPARTKATRELYAALSQKNCAVGPPWSSYPGLAEAVARRILPLDGVAGVHQMMMEALPGREMQEQIAGIRRALTDKQWEQIQNANSATLRQLNRDITTQQQGGTPPTKPREEPTRTTEEPRKPAELDVAKLRLRAAGGHLGAMLDLALIYNTGAGAPISSSVSVWWRDQAEQHGGVKLEMDSSDKTQFSINSLQQAAQQDSIHGHAWLSARFRDGKGVAKAAALAVDHLRRAADLGHYPSQFGYSQALLNGAHVERDPAGAVRYAKLAADGGWAPGMAHYAYLLDNGIGTPRDSALARQLNQRAAELGQTTAMHNLGIMLADGRGGPADPAAGVKWIKQAADKDYAASKKWLAENSQRQREADIMALGDMVDNAAVASVDSLLNANKNAGSDSNKIAELNRVMQPTPQALTNTTASADDWVARAKKASVGTNFTATARALHTAVTTNATIDTAGFEMYRSRGTMNLIGQQYAEAIKEFDEALKLRPDDPETLVKRGRAKLGLRNHAGGFADIETALRLNPQADLPAGVRDALTKWRARTARPGQ